MERKSEQERNQIFEHYMSLDPAESRHFIENKCASLAQSIFLDAQRLEMLSRRLEKA